MHSEQNQLSNNERFGAETEEFFEKYPDVDIDTVPSSVWEQVKSGKNLSSAYGEFSQRIEKIQAQNEKNRQSTPGGIGRATHTRGNFTESDVRGMTKQQIKDNYNDIIRSMGSNGFFK